METLFDLNEIPENNTPKTTSEFVITFTDTDGIVWHYRKPTGYEEYTGVKTSWIQLDDTRMKPKRYKTLATAQAKCRKLNALRTPDAIQAGVVCVVKAWKP